MAANMNERIVILETQADLARRDMVDLKTDMKAIREDVVGLKVDLARLTERVDHLPSKGYILTASLGIIGAIGAFIAFQDHIRAFFSH